MVFLWNTRSLAACKLCKLFVRSLPDCCLISWFLPINHLGMNENFLSHCTECCKPPKNIHQPCKIPNEELMHFHVKGCFVILIFCLPAFKNFFFIGDEYVNIGVSKLFPIWNYLADVSYSVQYIWTCHRWINRISIWVKKIEVKLSIIELVFE